MFKSLTLFALIVFTLSSQQVCATGPCPMVGCGAEDMRALGAKATAELATGERIQRWVYSEAIDRFIWHTVCLETGNSFDWRTNQAIEVFSRNLQRTPLAGAQSKQYRPLVEASSVP